MKNKFFGLRIITNLHCNQRCRFCFQVDKSNKILSLDEIDRRLSLFPIKSFKYATIMGGESFVLPNLHQYVYVASSFANEVRITTNGSLITREKLLRFKKLGLTGINISVASIKKYKEITNSKYDWPFILDKIKIAQEIFPDTARINMALCKENMFGEIKEMIHFFVSEMKLNVTICEDVLETYKALDDTEGKLGAKIVEDSGYGLVFLEHEGKRFGYYSHKDNYKNTDFILSPIGHFIAWNEYCQKVGLNYDNKD